MQSCNLTVDRNLSTQNHSAADRARRHGEVRMLKAIKRKQTYSEPRKRKLLKRQNYDEEEDFANHGEDIRDVDFRLHNDSDKLQVSKHLYSLN